MELPFELTRILPASLDVLRYMAHESITASDIESLVEGMGKSDRAVRKGIRELVNKGYLNMDAAGVYFLMDKGTQAAESILAYDAEHGMESESQVAQVIEHEIVAVVPRHLSVHQPTVLQFGFRGAPAALNSVTQIILRLSASSGVVAPAQLTIDLHPGQVNSPLRATFTPKGTDSVVRFRVEAVQMLGLTDAVPAGGMFFDVPIGDAIEGLRAWYGRLNLQV